MANGENKDTQNTSTGVDNQSTNLTGINSGETSETGSTSSAASNLSGGKFGNAGTTNPEFSGTGASTSGTTGGSLSNTQNKTGTDTDTTGLSVESAKETARGLYDSAKSTAGQAFGVATKRATEALDEKKVTVASGLTTVADSIKQVGENLNTTPEHNPIADTAAKYTNTIAEQIENISGYFERKDVREMVRDVENFARRYPAYFIGGAIALGFLAARFLKSSRPQRLIEGDGQERGGRTFTEDYDTGKNLTSGGTTPGASQF